MTDSDRARHLRPERFTAFVDAVVAIAMTLLVLPLVESVAEAGAAGLSTAEYLDEHAGQLFSFALSFVLIANAWMVHHRQYDEVTAITRPLTWINVVWMVSIVWLPVPTAMLAQMDTDPLQALLYIGTLMLTQAATLAARIYVIRHPDLTTAAPQRVRRGAAADIAGLLLLAIALVVTMLIGATGYFALMLLGLTGLIARVLFRFSPRAHRAPDAGGESRPNGSDTAPVG